MENNLIGSQIMKFRKAAGMTQEELGRSVGVSTQAVSRWECGGTPDVTLLPAIADRLGVTVDALFGREGGETVDLFQLARKWVHTLPKKDVLDQLNRLVWVMLSQVPFGAEVSDIPFLESSANKRSENSPYVLSSSKLELDIGVLFGVYAKDLSFTTLCPRPEKGYDAYFPEKEKFRAFCALLSKSGCLEIIDYLMHQNGYYFAAEAVAEGTGIPVDHAEEILEQMEQLNLLTVIEIGLRKGMEKVYGLQDASAFIPLAYLVNCMTQEEHFYYVNYTAREKPLL